MELCGAEPGGSAEPGLGIDVTRLPNRMEMPHIDFDRLTRVEGRPVEGSIVAYKLLELDASFCPQVRHESSQALALWYVNSARSVA